MDGRHRFGRRVQVPEMNWVRLGAEFVLTAQLSATASLSAQTAPTTALLDSKPVPGAAVLKICLRLEDESAFLGPATVRILPEDGNELLGMAADAPGEFMFSGVTSGKYVAVIGAPGYTILSLNFKIDDGPRQKSLFVPMKPRLNAASAQTVEVLTIAPPSAAPSASAPATPLHTEARASSDGESPAGAHDPAVARLPATKSGGRDFWNPAELETNVPPTEPGVSCPTDDILRGVGRRMGEFVQT